MVERNGWQIRIKFFGEKRKNHIFEGFPVRIGSRVAVLKRVSVNFDMMPCSDRFDIEIMAPQGQSIQARNPMQKTASL